MGTRAQIAYIVSPNKLATITNFYDGTPDYLGATLKKFYNNDEDAEMVVTDGPEISDINPDDGTINRYDNGTYVVLKGENEYEVFSMLYDRAKNTGSTYVYIWDGNEWLDAFVGKDREEFINTFSKNLEQPEQPYQPEQTGDGTLDIPFMVEKKDKIKEGVWSVVPARIPEFIKAIEDIKEKYHGVVGSDDVYNGLDAAIEAAEDLMSMSEGTKTKSDDLFEAEYTKRQWQYRAGIIK